MRSGARRGIASRVGNATQEALLMVFVERFAQALARSSASS